ncbi:MAG: hypothetical protein GX066_00270 [Clostridiaceae bacterium]|nr:hypothetical protein [Clostridiaceae bacterium]
MGKMNSNFSYEYVLSGNIKSEEIKNKFNLKDYFNFCKIYEREKKNKSSDKRKISDPELMENEFYERFNFVDKKFDRNKSPYRNWKSAEFPFLWLKKFKFQNKELEFKADTLLAENFAGIFQNTEDVKNV